jgi:ubiquinone/menaquinone biosynthesis C-methylase UbiE
VKPADQLQIDVYREKARAYDVLVRAEDCDGNLLPAIERRVSLAGARTIEVGAGTGRVTRLLVNAGADVCAFDRAPAMLAVARESLGDRARFAIADARALPVADRSFDLFVAGWVFGHLRMWMPEGWRDEVDRALDECERSLTSGGVAIVIETMGTGVETPSPKEALLEYYAHLEARGFSREVFPTDYSFESAEAAAACLGGFFGESMADRIRAHGWARVPEFTGVWSRTRP